MPAPAWAGDLLAALGIGTAEELEAYLKRGNNADRRIFQAARAPAIGWAAEVAPYPERGARVYSPGALRRWTLALPVYRSDQRQDGDYDAFGIRFKGNVDKDPTRDVFIRQRLKGMCICRFFFFQCWSGARSARWRQQQQQQWPYPEGDHHTTHTTEFFAPTDGGARPAPLASSSIVLADDGTGVWWPARLGTKAEREWYTKEFRVKKVRARGRRVLMALHCVAGKWQGDTQVCVLIVVSSVRVLLHRAPNKYYASIVFFFTPKTTTTTTSRRASASPSSAMTATRASTPTTWSSSAGASRRRSSRNSTNSRRCF